ncbi:hypothetical protein KI387_013291, partial [Taxus chinensis]
TQLRLNSLHSLTANIAASNFSEPRHEKGDLRDKEGMNWPKKSRTDKKSAYEQNIALKGTRLVQKFGLIVGFNLGQAGRKAAQSIQGGCRCADLNRASQNDQKGKGSQKNTHPLQ